MTETNPPAWDDLVLVGTIARPHGLRGLVALNPATDFLEERFRVGARFWTMAGAEGPAREARGSGLSVLQIESVRFQSGRPIVGFAGYASIEEAETLAGCELRIPEDALQPLTGDLYYHHQLVGCAVVTGEGTSVGLVVRVEGAGGSLLVVQGESGEVLIPLAHDICTSIDIEARRIEIAPLEGLLELNEGKPGLNARATSPADAGPHSDKG